MGEITNGLVNTGEEKTNVANKLVGITRKGMRQSKDGPIFIHTTIKS